MFATLSLHIDSNNKNTLTQILLLPLNKRSGRPRRRWHLRLNKNPQCHQEREAGGREAQDQGRRRKGQEGQGVGAEGEEEVSGDLRG